MPGREEPHVTQARKEKRRHLARLARRRRAKERFIREEQPESALSAVERCRAEKAKRIAEGKPVLKSIEQWRGIYGAPTK
jgi:hypothetical protein